MLKKFVKKGLTFSLVFVLTICFVIGMMPTNRAEAASSYTADWQRWSQGASGYPDAMQYGCRVTAYAKMLAEAGYTGFGNPDGFFDWGKARGYFRASDTSELTGFGVAPVTYVNSNGGTASLVGYKVLSKNKAADANTIMNLINQGYYVILTRPVPNQHSVYVGREASISQGTAVVLESWASRREGPSFKYANYTDVAFEKAYYFKITGNANNPTGVVDAINGGAESITVSGWAFDRDAVGTSLEIHVYIGGPAGSGEGHRIVADKTRTDVNAVYGVGNNHGYLDSIQTSKRGYQDVYVYAINVGSGQNVELGHGTVYIDNEKNPPVLSNARVTDISSSGYTVYVDVSDESGVARVQFPTWTEANGQDDLISDWTTNPKCCGNWTGPVTLINGNGAIGTWTFRVNTSEHNNESGAYITHIYAYDIYGNVNSCGVSVTVPETFIVVDGVLKEYHGDGGNVVIPEGVMSIGEDAFKDCKSLKNIVIPEGVTSIGGYAFYSCDNLESITIPASVTSIEYGVFFDCSSLTSINVQVENDNYASYDGNLYNKDLTELLVFSGGKNSAKFPESIMSIGMQAFLSCDNLESITIPAGVTSIGDGAFMGCSNLENISIPASVTSIGEKAFQACINLESIAIPEGVTSIGKEAFYNCLSLKSIVIPESVTSIGRDAFSDCFRLTNINVQAGNSNYASYAGNLYNKDLTELIEVSEGKNSVKFPKSITSIGDYAFSYCRKLENITIPEGVMSIGKDAFSSCGSLTSIMIPGNVTSIGDYAFSYCRKLESITIPDGVANIGKEAFRGCNSLTNINVQVGNSRYASYDGDLYNKDLTELIFFLEGKNSVKFPESITSIGDYAFSYCISLKSIVIPESVTSIGDYAFSNCSSLKNITIPTSVTSIGENAFSYCSNLENITIPEGVMSIGKFAFYDCNRLTSINVQAGNGHYASYDGNLYNKDLTELIFFLEGKKSVKFPESITSIGEYAFYYCSNLDEITIPESVMSIGEYAFYGSNLDEITIPEGVMSIGECTFSRCSSLKSITIPAGVTSIGDGAFSYCKNLESITIPDNVTNIGKDAFRICSSLKNIDVQEGNSNYASYDGDLYNKDLTELIVFSEGKNSVKFPESITSIGEYAFYGSNLKSITIPESVMSIGEYAFYGSSLKSITIPINVTSIGEYAFYHCSNLDEITIPESVTSIEEYAFSDCRILKSVTVLNKTVDIDESVFNGCDALKTIKGYKGSSAETFANENGYEFVELNDEETPSPSPKPSEGPDNTASPEPSKKPSTEPSAKPSTEPSAKPSVEPSKKPSAKPSAEPSTESSAKPSVEPSKKPSAKPSAEPSTEPSPKPSAKASSIPSLKPSAETGGTASPKPSTKPSMLPSPMPEFVLGDVTGDTKVTLADAQLTLKAALNLMKLDEAQKKAADIDGNGKIELKDAQKILRVALKLDTFDKTAKNAQIKASIKDRFENN